MKLLKYIFKDSKKEAAINILQQLGKSLIPGLSTEKDLTECESSLALIDEPILHGFNDLFLKYLLKHFPKDERLTQIYSNAEQIVICLTKQ